MNSASYKHIIQINIAMLCISTSGVLGRYVNTIPQVTIFWRAVLAGIILLFFCLFNKFSFNVKSVKDRWSIFLGGLFLGIHWVTFFKSLQLSNVAIGLISIFTYPVITTFLEPIWYRTKLQKSHVILALLVLIGIYFLVPEFTIQNNYTVAILWGITSAFFYALRNLIMKPKVSQYNGSVLMMYQILVVALVLLPLVLSNNIIDSFILEWKPFFALALITTAIGHTLFLMSFKKLSVSSASILSGVQPIYGIILGMIFLSEYPAVNTIIGGIIIISAVIIESYRSVKKH